MSDNKIKVDMTLVDNTKDGDLCRRCAGLTCDDLNCQRGRWHGREGRQAEIAFVGEAPGTDEVYSQEFFVGKAGQRLHNWINELCLNRKRIWLDNAVRCALANTHLANHSTVQKKKLINNCRPYLFRELERLKPKVIVALGNAAVKSLTGSGMQITKWHGRKLIHPDLQTYIVPVLHPAAILRREQWARQAMEDIDFASSLINAPRPSVDLPRTVIVETERKFKGCLREMQESDEIALDFETTGLDFQRDKILGLVVCAHKNHGWFIPFMRIKEELVDGDHGMEVLKSWDETAEMVISPRWLGALKRVVTNKKKLKIMHNAGFDLLWFKRLGWDAYPVFDTMVVNAIIDSLDNGLSELSWLYTNFGGYDDELLSYVGTGKKKQYIKAPPDILGIYGCLDGVATFRIRQAQKKELKRNKQMDRLCKEHNELRWNLTEMEFEGTKINKAHVRKLREKYSREVNELVKRLRKGLKRPTLNLNSAPQMLEAFWGPGGLLNIRDYRFIRKPSTAQKVMKKVERFTKGKKKLQVLEDLRQYRVLSKRISTYLDNFMKCFQEGGDGRVRTHFTQDVTRTGRLSSHDPALQNIPRLDEMRNCFVAEPGHSFIEWDYCQLEVCIAAEESRDEVMLDIINTEQDYHSFVGANTILKSDGTKYDRSVFVEDKEMRSKAKTVTFSVFYGKTPETLADDLKCSVDEAASTIKLLTKDAFPDFGDWMIDTFKEVHTTGKVVTIFGRNLPVQDAGSPDAYEQAAANRKAVNYKIQSAASDCVVIGINRVAAKLRRAKLPARLRLTVHDSLLVEVPDAYVKEVMAIGKREMEKKIPEIKYVKLRVDCAVGKRWGAMKEIKI